MSDNEAPMRTQFDNEVQQLKAIRAKLQMEFERLAGPELENMLKGREETLSYLKHTDPNCRCAALSLLTDHWKAGEANTIALEVIALTDPETMVRCVALFCLGSIYRNTRNARVGRILAQVATDESQHPKTREAAYKGLLDLAGVPVQDRPLPGRFELREADWRFVAAFLIPNA